MYDGPTQTSPDFGDMNMAKVAAPSPLAQLIDTQEKTKHLLTVLAERLAPVSNPRPVDAKERLNGGYHIQSALSQQHEINDAINYILDTVVV